MIAAPRDRLTPGQIQLWILPSQQEDIDRLRADGTEFLSPDEQRRRDDMRNPRVADRYVLGRILLRSVLARCLGEAPATLEFRYNANGKPELADQSDRNMSFNLSHSVSDMVLAVGHASAIGVDLESVDRAAAAHRISQRFFSPDEIQQLETLGQEAEARALILWSLKESIVKAKGETVWDGLANLSLAIEGRQISFSSTPNTDKTNWQLAAGPFGENHILALAVDSSDDQMVSPLAFQIHRLGSNTKEPNDFEPLFST